MAFHDPLAHGQSNPGARVFVTGVEPLKDHKDPLGVAGLDADAIVPYRE
jgi:hypothetical protein